MTIDAGPRGRADQEPSKGGARRPEVVLRVGPMVNCIRCHYLSAITCESLPEPQRAELTGRSPESFTWVSCAKAMEQLPPTPPEVFDAVLQDRRCGGFQPYDQGLTTNQMLQRELQEEPPRSRIPLAIGLLLLLIAAIWIAIELAT